MRLLALVSCLFFLSCHATAMSEVPYSYCDPQFGNCSEPTKFMIKKYWQSLRPELTAEAILFTGSCYVVNSSMAPDHEHHGYIFLHKNSSQNFDYSFFGEFAFFYDSNPYLSLDLAELKKRHPEPSKRSPFPNRHNWQMAYSEDPPFDYYMRISQDQHLMIVGFWGIRDSIVCDLAPYKL